MVSPDDIDDLWTKPAKLSRAATRKGNTAGKGSLPAAGSQQQQPESSSGELDRTQHGDVSPSPQQRHVGFDVREPAMQDASPAKAGGVAASSRRHSDEAPSEPRGASPSRVDGTVSAGPTPKHPDGAHITGADYRRARTLPRQSASVPHSIGVGDGGGGSQHGPGGSSRRLRPIKTAPVQRAIDGDDDAAQVTCRVDQLGDAASMFILLAVLWWFTNCMSVWH